MKKDQNIKDEILLRAEKVMYFNDLIIERCNNLRSVEEGDRIMMKKIMEREKELGKIRN